MRFFHSAEHSDNPPTPDSIGRDSMWKWSFTFKRTILRYLNGNLNRIGDENCLFKCFGQKILMPAQLILFGRNVNN